MSHVLVCEIGPDATPHLMAHRLRHLEYIAAKRDQILFGGPARAGDGQPQTMIIVLRTADRREAEAFIAAEPYSASGQVFSAVTVRPWTQVVPEPVAGALASAITQEQAKLEQRP